MTKRDQFSCFCGINGPCRKWSAYLWDKRCLFDFADEDTCHVLPARTYLREAVVALQDEFGWVAAGGGCGL